MMNFAMTAMDYRDYRPGNLVRVNVPGGQLNRDRGANGGPLYYLTIHQDETGEYAEVMPSGLVQMQMGAKMFLPVAFTAAWATRITGRGYKNNLVTGVNFDPNSEHFKFSIEATGYIGLEYDSKTRELKLKNPGKDGVVLKEVAWLNQVQNLFQDIFQEPLRFDPFALKRG